MHPKVPHRWRQGERQAAPAAVAEGAPDHPRHSFAREGKIPNGEAVDYPLGAPGPHHADRARSGDRLAAPDGDRERAEKLARETGRPKRGAEPDAAFTQLDSKRIDLRGDGGPDRIAEER